MDGVNPKILYEAWLEQKKEEDPDFEDDDPLLTQSEFIELCKPQEENKIEEETTELENHMVVGEYYNDEGEPR